MFKSFFQSFHFLHPEWLLALLPVALLLWLMYRPASQDSPWKKVIDPVLQPLFLTASHGKSSQWILGLLSTGWLLGVLAMADPVWQQYPRPVFQSSHARVIVLDLSRSMEIGDLKPSRLSRARFKINDILAREEEGQLGLVAFAGDAFTVSPLTRDADTIRALLPSLTPDLMPVQGSRVDLGLIKAGELLKQAGLSSGQILLLADGTDSLDGELAINTAKQLSKQGYSVSVLGVGTSAGAPIPRVTDQQGKPIVVKLETENLQAIAKAGHGHYRTIQGSDADINALLATNGKVLLDKNTPSSDLKSQDWKSQGPLFILLLLPLAAFAFRRGWLLSLGLVVVVVTGGTPQPVMASGWDNAWQRQDQQAAKALKQGDYQQASALAKDPLRYGSAEYKQGHYDKALQSFSQVKGATARYNEGNALARLNKLKEAIAAYDKALQENPTLKDAAINKKRVEELLKKQQEQQKKQQQQNQKNQQKDQKNNSQNNDDKKNKDQSNKDQQQSKNTDSQNKPKDNKDSQAKKDNQSQQNKDQQQQAKSDKNKEKKDSSSDQQQAKSKDKPANTENKTVSEDKKQPEKDQTEQQKNQFAEAKKQLEKDKQKQAAQAAKHKQQANAAKANAPTQQEKKDKQQQTKAAQQATPQEKQGKQAKKDKEKPKTQAEIEAENLNKEEKIAAEQWLRSIPDDPGGLLRRKFKYQYQQREQRQGTGGRRPW